MVMVKPNRDLARVREPCCNKILSGGSRPAEKHTAIQSAFMIPRCHCDIEIKLPNILDRLTKHDVIIGNANWIDVFQRRFCLRHEREICVHVMIVFLITCIFSGRDFDIDCLNLDARHDSRGRAQENVE